MKEKILFAAALAFSAAAYAQTGINTENPAATLDVTAKSTDPETPEGIIAPRLEGDDLKAKSTATAPATPAYDTAQIGAIVYVTKAVTSPGSDPTTDPTANVTAPGYYYFDNNKTWQPMNNTTAWYTGAAPVSNTDDPTAPDATYLNRHDLIYHNSDIYANAVRLGRGAGNDATNTVAGANALENSEVNTQQIPDFTPVDIVTWTAEELQDQENDLMNKGAYYNSAFGYNALKNNGGGAANTAVGYEALTSINASSGNTAVGTAAMAKNTHGQLSTAVGAFALFSAEVPVNSTAVGYGALEFAQGGSGANTAVGTSAMGSLMTGDSNTALGANALRFSFATDGNTALGTGALQYLNTGNNNIAIGRDAGHIDDNNILYNNNIAIGGGTSFGEPNHHYDEELGQEVYDSSVEGRLNIGNVLFGSGGSIGINVQQPQSTLEVNGSYTNTAAYDASNDAGGGTTIDFTKSNLAYTTTVAETQYTINGIKDGGVYNLAMKIPPLAAADPIDIANIGFANPNFTFHLISGGIVTGLSSFNGFVITFKVIGSDVYYTGESIMN